MPSDLDYFWPPPDDVAEPPDSAAAGMPIWALPGHSPKGSGDFLDEGAVGSGTESGVTGDASGRDLAALRALAQTRVPRAARWRPCHGSCPDVQPGDQVAVLVQGGRNLLLGAVEGDYEFRPASGPLTHRRAVGWDRLVSRAAVRPTYALQDVRPLVRVRLAAGPAGSSPPGAMRRLDPPPLRSGGSAPRPT